MITDGDFCIRFIPFPGKVKALVTLDENNFYSIYVNSNLPYEIQKEAVKHELRHILRNDFNNDLSIHEIESE